MGESECSIKNIEAKLSASKEIGIEVKAEKTGYAFMYVIRMKGNIII
jgi:hypothetical protein